MEINIVRRGFRLLYWILQPLLGSKAQRRIPSGPNRRPPLGLPPGREKPFADEWQIVTLGVRAL
jgi:hypothetical protein